VIENLNKEVNHLIGAARHEEALPLAIEAYAAASADLSENDEDYATSIYQLIVVYRAVGKMHEADRLLERAISSCSEAFLRKDYLSTIKLAYDLKDLAPPFLPARLLLISFQRLHDADLFNYFQRLMTECVSATEAYPWDRALLLLALGLSEFEVVLTEARTDDQKCQANYYMAAKLLTQGRLEQARYYLEVCLEISSDCPEYHLAVAESLALQKSLSSIDDNKAADTDATSLRTATGNPRATAENNNKESVFPSTQDLFAQRLRLANRAKQALSFYDQGRFDEAIRTMLEVRDASLSLVSENHADYATCCHNLGLMYRAVGLFPEAISSTRKAIEIRRRVHGGSHPLIAQSLSQLGEIYRRVGNIAEAEGMVLEAREILLRVVGDKHPDYATALNDLALIYVLKGKYLDAEPLYRESLDIYTAYYGQNHRHFLQVLNNFGNLLNNMGRLVEAESVLQGSLAACSKVLGDSHPLVAQNLINLAALYDAMGKKAKIKDLLERSCEVLRRSVGEQHPEYGAALNNLGSYYLERGEYETAEHLLKQATEITAAAIGKQSDDYSLKLSNLAVLYSKWGKYSAAVQCMDEAAQTCRSSLGENNPSFARCLMNQASILQELGKYVDARERLQRVDVILRDVVGEEHLEYADYLHNAAALYALIGDYPEAVKQTEKSLNIRRKILGEDHSAVAASMSSLGVYLNTMGELVSAESLLQRAAVILRSSLGEYSLEYVTALQNQAMVRSRIQDKETAVKLLMECIRLYSESTGGTHPNMGRCLTTLAGISVERHDYYRAEILLEAAAENCRNALGENNVTYAEILHSRATIAFHQGDYTRAEELSRQALDIWLESAGERHLQYASGLNDLAVIKQRQGDSQTAELLYRQAANILKTTLGTHPEYSLSLVNLATCRLTMGKQDEALDLFLQAATIDDRMIGQVFSITSERQRRMYLKRLEYRFHLFLSLVTQLPADSANAVQAFQMILRRKAIVTEAQAAQRDAILTGRYPGLQTKVSALTALTRQIAEKQLAGPGREEIKAFRELLARWNEQRQQQEAQLAREIPEVNLEQKLRAADLEAILLALPEGVALVEFVRLHVADFQAKQAKGGNPWKGDHYLAFVVRDGAVTILDLGDATAIDRMIADFRTSITGEAEVQDREGDSKKLVHSRPAAVAHELRTHVFDKLIPALGGCKRLLLAPDGDLSRLPFEVLPNQNGHRLIDDYFISYLNCGRDLLRISTPPWGKANVPLVVADPDFDLQITNVSQPSVAAHQGTSHSALSHRSTDLERSKLRFEPLPKTRIEGERIAGKLGVEPWLEADALEARLKSCHSPSILHLATHGFFLSDQQREPYNELGHLEPLSPANDLWPRLVGPWLENPLLRSGLALAGANTFLDHGVPPAEAEDGILTAEDVSGLDLSDTDLVVLSACDTGLGEVHVGEGVFGLRRSFVLAGAKTLVMSLWKVPDEQTRELMEDFYCRVLAGESRAGALRGAQLAMKDKYPHPFYWGAFICEGDPGPLRPLAKDA
jgi:CHAT domain-containing protein/Tfp pilus assembly protein PilF